MIFLKFRSYSVTLLLLLLAYRLKSKLFSTVSKVKMSCPCLFSQSNHTSQMYSMTGPIQQAAGSLITLYLCPSPTCQPEQLLIVQAAWYNEKSADFTSRSIRVILLGLPLPGSVTMGRSLKLSEPSLPHLL